jgi:N-acetylmuramoyl-L-alanine amidase
MTWQEGLETLAVRTAGVAFLLVCGALAALMGQSGGAERGGVARAQAPAAEAITRATDVRLGGDDAQTRFVLDLSRKIDLRAFTLADPYRVVVDLPQVAFHLPGKAGESGRGLVKAYRYGLVMPGGSRIVFDLTRPVRIDKAFVLDAADGHPARLVLDLVAVDRDSFLRTIALENRSARVDSARRSSAPTSDKNGGDPRPIVVIDPGHGGIDHGTRAPSGELEKAIVLEFGLLLRDRIERVGKYRVVMTRSDDTFVPLAERVRLARSRQAAMFISIHADALARGDGDAHGATIYTLSETASDSDAARLADAENRSDVISGVDLSVEPSDVADILIDLAQRETKTFSIHLARSLAKELKLVARLHKHPLKSAGFRVLRAPDVPSVLLELGYVSNRQDLKLLTSTKWRTRTADSIVQAIDTYFATRVAGSGARPGSN